MNPLTGQVEDNGTSIVDVTDPKHPRYLHHIPGAVLFNIDQGIEKARDHNEWGMTDDAALSTPDR